jgi:hypothetical protein
MEIPWKIERYYHLAWFKIYFPLLMFFWTHEPFISISRVVATLKDLVA